jgi:hypothetical protein
MKPLNPDYEFKHISCHVIHILARYLAREEVKRQLRADGVRNVLPRQINELATQYLHDHPECWREALTQAHRIDDKEGERKARQRLRREQLRKIRSSPSVTWSDNVNGGGDFIDEISTTRWRLSGC